MSAIERGRLTLPVEIFKKETHWRKHFIGRSFTKDSLKTSEGASVVRPKIAWRTPPSEPKLPRMFGAKIILLK